MSGIISPSKWGRIIQLLITILIVLACLITESSFSASVDNDNRHLPIRNKRVCEFNKGGSTSFYAAALRFSMYRLFS